MAIVDDDFSGSSLGAHWTEYDPSGDLTVTVSGGVVELALASTGSGHDFWQGDASGCAIFQDFGDTEFEVETGFDTTPTGDNAHGIIAVDDCASPENYVRFDMYGTTPTLFFARISPVDNSIWVNTTPAVTPLFLRLRREQNGATWDYSGEYSDDGVSWIGVSGGSHALALDCVGLWVGDYSSAPGHTVQYDYFRDNLAAPVGVVGVGDADAASPTAGGVASMAMAGAGAATLAPPAASGVGALALEGVGDATVAPPTAAGISAGAPTTGAGDATLTPPTAGGAGSLSMSGVGAATLAPPAAGGAGALALEGAGDATVAPPIAAGEGDHSTPTIEAVGDATVAPPIAEGVVGLTITAVGDATLSPPTAGTAGTVPEGVVRLQWTHTHGARLGYVHTPGARLTSTWQN